MAPLLCFSWCEMHSQMQSDRRDHSSHALLGSVCVSIEHAASTMGSCILAEVSDSKDIPCTGLGFKNMQGSATASVAKPCRATSGAFN